MRYLIYKIFTRLFFIAYSYKDSKLRLFFENQFNQNRFPDFTPKYDAYRKTYKLNPDFRFNGVYILLYGNGEILTGENSYIGDFSTVYAHDNHKVVIGNNVRISHNVRIYTQSVKADQDFSQKPVEEKIADVIIEDYAWIGANVFINPGVKIGYNSVVGANSVVTKDIPANTIWGGVPAKLIKEKSTK